jgi:hypothetical protein
MELLKPSSDINIIVDLIYNSSGNSHAKMHNVWEARWYSGRVSYLPPEGLGSILR